MACRRVEVSRDHVQPVMGTSPQKAVEECYALLPSILDKAFKGEL